MKNKYIAADGELWYEHDYLNPDWGQSDWVHNWRNYVSEDLQQIWGTFTPLQKIKIARSCQAIADREDWD